MSGIEGVCQGPSDRQLQCFQVVAEALLPSHDKLQHLDRAIVGELIAIHCVDHALEGGYLAAALGLHILQLRKSGSCMDESLNCLLEDQLGSSVSFSQVPREQVLVEVATLREGRLGFLSD